MKHIPIFKTPYVVDVVLMRLMTFCAFSNPHPSTSASPHSKITYLFVLAVRSYSHRGRGVQSPPGQNSDGISDLLHPSARGSGAGSLPGRVPVGQDSDDRRPDEGGSDPRGRWVVCTWWGLKWSHVASMAVVFTAKERNKTITHAAWEKNTSETFKDYFENEELLCLNKTRFELRNMFVKDGYVFRPAWVVL